MPIVAQTPKTVPAQEEAVYDKYYMTFFQSRGADPNAPVAVDIQLRLGKQDKNGVWSFDPNEEPVKISIADVFALASQRQDIAMALGALLAAVEAYARDENKIR